MGPLVSVAQRDEVRARVGELVAAGGEIVVGSLDDPEVLGVDGVRRVKAEGAFLAPVLLRFASRDGADTAVWLCLLPSSGPTGQFFRDRQPIPW